MVYEMTFQFQVADFKSGVTWYSILLNRKPDFTAHDGFAEWELLPGCWLQIAHGHPSGNSGPLRLGVFSIEEERDRMVKEFGIEFFDIQSREEVPVKWATFSDPWGNRIGFFEYIDEGEKQNKINDRERIK
ncbi:VOC family protein [Bacillus suaedaesalsae]|uniref:VOC family protein n=1 Tax=Bacillus suaedaesalsae TaxID=2810349 RepID=A0ABS2DL15_9BACI|nr:VOC family protein [Bacillus suaedaesalsae]MBM6619192.1 VOC family protein [Bacillus suaedaesalsae]